MKNKGKLLCGILFGLFLSFSVYSQESKTIPKGSGVCPPFPLRDEKGEVINPVKGINDKVPYSPKQTCGAKGCHNYDKITEGYHFQQGKGEKLPQEYGERYNWVLYPGNYGGNWCSPAPLYRQLAPKKNDSARTIDMTSFDFVSASCGACHPGGGPLEYDRDGKRYDERMNDPSSGLSLGGDNGYDGDYYKARWSETGVIEADCLLCHQPEYNYKKRCAELENLNFRWAATSGAGFAMVTGAVGRGEKPEVYYDKSKFDTDGNIIVHIVPEPRNENCLNCHSKPGWKKRGSDFTSRNDVHLAAGFRCVDCHEAGSRAKDERIRGKEVHQFGKGDDPSGFVRNDLDDSVRRCDDCHTSGYRNAPIARHEWLPPLHLEKFSCQACHIPARSVKSALVQASDVYNAAPRITPPGKHIWTFYDQQMNFWNHYGELNLFTAKDKPTDITRPTLIKYKGKIYPANRVHSTFVGLEEKGKKGLNQLFMKDFYKMWVEHRSAPESNYPELKEINDDNGDGVLEINRPEEIDAIISASKKHLEKTGYSLEGRKVVYVADSRVYYSSNEFRDLPKHDYEATPYASVYKFSHDIYPARAALGAKGCRDCHSKESPFFFGTVLEKPFGEGGSPVWKTQSELLGYNGSWPSYTGFAGLVAAFFKWLTIIVLTLLFGHIILDVFSRLQEGKATKDFDALEKVERFNDHFRAQHILLMLSVAILSISGLFIFSTRFAGAHWAASLSGALGGLNFWRVIHRSGGVLLIITAAYHIIYSIVNRDGRRDFVLMLPNADDFTNLLKNIKLFFGISKNPPEFGRFTYFEKFDYWAVFWGSAIMIGSGLAMWFNDIVLLIYPGAKGSLFDALKEAHAHEAVLAVVTIVTWHFYNVHLRPGRFPGNLLWIHGMVSREEIKREHPKELMKND